MNDQDEPALEVDHDPGVESDAPLSDSSLLELLDALVAARGRVPASRALGVNYRTLASCCDTRQVSRRMPQALVVFRDAGGVVGAQPDGAGDGNDTEERGDMLASRVEELEAENAGFQGLGGGAGAGIGRTAAPDGRAARRPERRRHR